jgi:hypothetical protein
VGENIHQLVKAVGLQVRGDAIARPRGDALLELVEGSAGPPPDLPGAAVVDRRVPVRLLVSPASSMAAAGGCWRAATSSTRRIVVDADAAAAQVISYDLNFLSHLGGRRRSGATTRRLPRVTRIARTP